MKKQQHPHTTSSSEQEIAQQVPPAQSNADKLSWMQQIQQGGAAIRDNIQQGVQTIQQGVQTVAPIVHELPKRIRGQGTGDIQREGTISDPKTTKAVTLETAFSEAKENNQNFGAWLMKRYAFQPSKEFVPNDPTLRIFSPGLNTAEPEGSKRTAYYADKLGQPMVHIHNGSNEDAQMPFADKLDYLTALMARHGLKETKLMQSLVQILQKALAGTTPQDVHAILYSDSTIAGSRAIAKVRAQMISSRIKKGMSKEKATQEVHDLLSKHLFVEMHGNVAKDLPEGPKYVLWADNKDDITHGRTGSVFTEMGFSGKQQDSNADVLYIDYDGPFGKADAHNLQAVGVHVARQTWWANGVRNSQELFELYKKQGSIRIPKQFIGDGGKLWDPHNNPNWKPPQ